MSAGFRLIAPITIRMDGTIVVDGDTYWCEELSARIGETVAVRTAPNTRTWVQVLSQCGDEFLCCADMIKDGEQEAADRRLRAARHASVVRGDWHVGPQQVEGCPDRIRGFSHLINGSLGRGLGSSAIQLLIKALKYFRVRLRNGVEKREYDQAQGADISLGLSQAAPEQCDVVLNGRLHQASPSKSSAKQPATSGGTGHRLSEDSE